MPPGFAFKVLAAALLFGEALYLARWHQLRGPTWLATRQSPDFAYVESARALTRGEPPVAVAAHPGFSYSVLLATVFHFFPEIRTSDLIALQFLGFALLVMSLSFLLTGPQTLLLASLPLWSLCALERWTRLTPEALALSCQSAALLLVTRISRARTRLWLRALVALLLAVAVAAKITFLPVALLALVMQTRREAVASMAWGLLFFALLCLPFSYTKPLHDLGDFSLPTLNATLAFVRQLAHEEPWFLLLPAVLIWALPTLIPRRYSLPIFTCHLALVLTRPSPHYLLAWLAVFLLAIYKLSENKGASFPFLASPWVPLLGGMTVASLQIARAEPLLVRLHQEGSQRMLTQQVVSAVNRPFLVCNYASFEAFAKHKGRVQAGISQQAAGHTTPTEKNFLGFCDWNLNLAEIAGTTMSLTKYLASAPPTLIWGPANSTGALPHIPRRRWLELSKDSPEGLYLLK